MTTTPMRRLSEVPLLQGIDYAVTAPELRRSVAAPLAEEPIDWGLVVVLRRKQVQLLARQCP